MQEGEVYENEKGTADSYGSSFDYSKSADDGKCVRCVITDREQHRVIRKHGGHQ